MTRRATPQRSGPAAPETDPGPLLAAAKHPLTVLAGRYGHPLHPVVVPVPIGCWVAAFVFDLSSHVVGDSAFLARAAYWLVALGVVGAVAAATLGFLDLLVIPGGTPAFRTALVHMSLNLTATAVFGGELAVRPNSANAPATPGWLVVLSACALLVVAAGGYLGGELAYRYGVRVADEATQITGFRAEPRGGGRTSWTSQH